MTLDAECPTGVDGDGMFEYINPRETRSAAVGPKTAASAASARQTTAPEAAARGLRAAQQYPARGEVSTSTATGVAVAAAGMVAATASPAGRKEEEK